jgi:hypothetical protein
MMMMVTTSEVWFSLFQGKNSHDDGNNQSGVVLSFSKNEPVGADPRWQFSKKLMWNCGSQKIGHRANPELWFFADCFRKPTKFLGKPTMNFNLWSLVMPQKP